MASLTCAQQSCVAAYGALLPARQCHVNVFCIVTELLQGFFTFFGQAARIKSCALKHNFLHALLLLTKLVTLAHL